MKHVMMDLIMESDVLQDAKDQLSAILVQVLLLQFALNFVETLKITQTRLLTLKIVTMET